ncbi:UDP-N-acetylmuramoyl-tripeptide--D-alanyl-D-alanine ligase [Paracoccus denitrificans]|jgi:UDP-N-acetylmuramoyl-tripeptide--D-alanyl-D-alanine ligase|uniref:UDP-N-acetylmuramoyl-tripeptide--D-alanyl-D-alanine ligase n=1 Tax=Paracoccus denitrificans (strain Pd 1222) TaxID=318586 RepID=A1AZK5_PARDP|nr:UDP-N-acetylmuramoyl-tripeptide--D-alanyl-D-alanine ligase [Paracoccus denitrificans]ABL68699.1 UDP-N-acetylmuramoyl-tripeptide--D-alanyl-D-alanine ligase [Paracoccus denitrificans PD1222]MBB4625575.1 UDP-N-acetylmuramoyl-tripeptide--D-alanyl-D-alanine ligase [Paracoccus denitrificans]MCU7427256.1 UDP-N-acetylmuramoyl-tripeptide--D-alanyl-D-alanine ligase [Paracoccus denitrificans]QAR26755.1 UDP-N-acetylmuramoyl-tripeptide--D-alanyl-D-alanine ligase [Paracoccus denitrificans]UPV95706.1 UDP-
MTLWTSQDAAEATGGRATRDFAVGGVSIDTRTIRPGDLFVALQAARDGHDFVARALEKGACAALVSRIPEGVAPDAPLLVVPDVLPALEALGRAGRARMRGKVVAITGSVGKTSTKEMARVALAGQGRVHAAEASYNNHWGVPLTLARMPEDTDFAIVEIGMNHPGEIEPLARLARPHVAMVTTVAAAHLEAFGAIEGIAREKGAIFRGLIQPGTAIIPEDLPVTQLLRDCADDAAAIVIGFGQQGMARPLKAETLDGVTRVRARVLGETVDFMLASAGTHFVMNAVGMLAALSAAGADVAEAAKHLSDWRPPLGRGAVEDLDGIRLIDDAYNSNPTSLSAGLATLARLTGGRRVAILGDMLELGPDEIALHAGMAGDPAMEAVDLVHTAGPRMRALHEALPQGRRGMHAETAAELAGKVGELVASGDIVLVKGSKSSKVSTVVDALRRTRQSTPPGERTA